MLNVLGRNGVDIGKQAAEVALGAMMKEGAAKIKCKLLVVVYGNANLSAGVLTGVST